MAFNLKSSKKKRFFISTNITPFLIIITGGVAVLINVLNTGIIKLTLPETIIIALLVLLALDAFIERLKEFDEIKRGIEELKNKKNYKFLSDIKVVWDLAIEMLEKVGKEGHIYDSSSIKNRDSYEKAIEEKYNEGTEIIRIICSNNHQKRIENFINLPQNYKKKKSKGHISVYHLPYAIPFDVLITHDRDKIQAIIGFKTDSSVETQYTSALYISDREFATEIKSILTGVLLPDANTHIEKIKNNTTHTCNICKDIMKE